MVTVNYRDLNPIETSSVYSALDPKADYIGTEPWNPKEAIEGGLITDKADIFAYGLTLWEMMTLSIPHLEVLDSEEDTGNLLHLPQ